MDNGKIAYLAIANQRRGLLDSSRALRDCWKCAPKSPGVYLFRDSSGAVIYVGKAKSLRDRAASYFSSSVFGKTAAMVGNARALEFIVTDSEGEALVLENSLIKKNQPKYNIDLKGSEKYTYIVITNEKYPKMLLVRRNNAGKIGERGRAYGPFTSGSAYVLVASTLRKIFKIRTCRLGQKRPCLQYHLGFCMGVCAGLVSEEEYGKQVEKLKKVLSGGEGLEKVIEGMEKEMGKAASEKRFEKAIELRNSIRALASLQERQKMESVNEGNEDFVAIVMENEKAHVQIFRQIGGVIRDRKKFGFETLGEPLSEFLPIFYEGGGIPRRVFVENEFEGREALEKYLEGKRGGAVSLIVPQKGDKKAMLELLRRNILLEMEGGAAPELVELQKEFSLPSVPRVIECFDVSNLMGSNVVGSMSRLVDGTPDKNGYRRFKIRTVEGQDDFASMKEIVFRRYSRLRRESANMPDLVLVDGGMGQLGAALAAMQEAGVELPCIGIAKEFEEIYSPDENEPMRLPERSGALKVLQRARDEAHRFGIAYHRLLRKKNLATQG